MRSNEDLAIAIKAGEKEAMNQLYYQCKGFICKQAIRWGVAWRDCPSFDTDDLMQAGYMALYDAVEHYQPERGGFLNFLLFYLKIEFSNVAGCRTPAQMKEPLNTYISLETPVRSETEGEITIADTIPAEEEGFCKVEESVYQKQLAGIINEALSALPDRQRLAIAGHYLQDYSLAQVEEGMNISGERVRQILNDGLRSLRRGSYMQSLREFMFLDADCYQYTGFNAWRASGCSVQERALLHRVFPA